MAFKNNRVILLSAAIGFLFISAWSFFGPALHDARAVDDGASDAIAIRIVPNLNLFSISRWYESRGFKGAPQSLVVDGYEAIRDGRTVYINAAKIVNSSFQKLIYSNIYIISYNQDQSSKTVDILGQIISKWKFNTNIVDMLPPTCSISALSCDTDADCPSDQSCAGSSLGTASSSCVLRQGQKCLTDVDCPAGLFCDSLKAKAIRDVRRAGQIRELEEALFKFKESTGHYPVLGFGTYLLNKTVSTWPSWSQVFLPSLAVTTEVVDKINRLGSCPTYDRVTCWDENTKTFAGSENYYGGLSLPPGSYAMSYSTDSAGSNYNLCAVMETSPLGFVFYGQDGYKYSTQGCGFSSGVNIGGQATNTAPHILEANLNGEAGQEFNGFVKAVDDQGNPMIWSMPLSLGNWSHWQTGGVLGAPPQLQDTNDPQQKKLFSEIAGDPGTYNINIRIEDSQGAVLNTSLPIMITNNAPFIEAEDGEYLLNPNTPLQYSFFFSDNNIPPAGAPSAYTATKISGPVDVLNLPGATRTVSSAGINKYKVNYQVTIPPAYKFYNDTDLVYRFKVVDSFGASSTKQATIRILVDNPSLDFNCPEVLRKGKLYSCFIGRTIQNNNLITYSTSTLPNQVATGLYLEILTPAQQAEEESQGGPISQLKTPQLENLSLKRVFSFLTNLFYQIAPVWGAPPGDSDGIGIGIDPISPPPPPETNNYVYLRGTPNITSTGSLIKVKATNEHGASSTKDLLIKVNTFCGDALKQTPNLEGGGGYYNDGYEDCDGLQGVTSSTTLSNIALQYGCRTGLNATTTYPIPNNSYCIFKSPLDGGGYCGDTYCQSEIELDNGTTIPMENPTNCPVDCGAPAGGGGCVADCFNKQCGNDGCGGSCGACLGNQTCINFQCVVSCTPNCVGKECGNDGCGGSCGTCPTGETCNSVQQCVATGHCGNGNCQASLGENCATCPQDCACGLGQGCCNAQCRPSNYTPCGTINCCSPFQECCPNGVCRPVGNCVIKD